MVKRQSLGEIKEWIGRYIGQQVSLVTDRGKRKMKTRNGVVTNVFRNVFTVEIEEGFNSKRTVSFSYTDVLTENVEFIIDDTNENLLEEKIDII